MANKYYAGSGSVTFRAKLTDPDSGALVAATTATCEIRQAESEEYRYWSTGTVQQAATSMSSSATGEYYYVWALSGVSPGKYTAQVYITRGGQPSVERLTVEVL